MPPTITAPIEDLPANVSTLLSQFVETAKNSFASDLVSIVLYGSGAEGKLGPASDVNVLLVLRSFVPEEVAGMQGTYLAAHAAIKLRVMFLLEDEVAQATECFAQKFADIVRRHKVLFGKDVFSGMTIDRERKLFRLRQMVLNLTLRLRGSYVLHGQQPEQVVRILADLAGPLRAASATLLELEGKPVTDTSSALLSVAASLGEPVISTVKTILATHQGVTNEGAPADASSLFRVMELLRNIADRAHRLRGNPA